MIKKGLYPMFLKIKKKKKKKSVMAIKSCKKLFCNSYIDSL